MYTKMLGASLILQTNSPVSKLVFRFFHTLLVASFSVLVLKFSLHLGVSGCTWVFRIANKCDGKGLEKKGEKTTSIV